MTASLPSVSLADSLIQALRQPGQERLLDLVRNPLRLSLLCETWNGSSLPDTQAQLYENYLQKVYTWNRNPDIRNDQATRCRTNITKLKKRLNKQLGKLAKAALDLPQEHFRLSQRLVEEYLGEEIDNQSLCYLALRLGLLNRVGVDSQCQAIFAFYHATFQEYFAALSVDDWDYFLPRNHVNFPVQGKEYRIFEPQWKQVILLWIGRTNLENKEKENFIQKLIDFEDGCSKHNFYQFRSEFLAAWLIQDFKNYEKTNLLIDWLIKTGLGSWNSKTNAWEYYLCVNSGMARKILTEINTDLVREKILEIIDQTDEQFIIRHAIWCLGKMYPTSDRVIKKLLSFIRKSSKDATEYNVNSVHMQAIESLSGIAFKNQEVISFLKELIDSRIDFSTELRAMKTLAKISPESVNEVSDILLEMLKETDHDGVRCYLAIALGEVSPTHQDFIIDLSSKIELNDESISFVMLKRYLASIQKKPIFTVNQELDLIAGIIEAIDNIVTDPNEKTKIIETLNPFLESSDIENKTEIYKSLLDIIQSPNLQGLGHFIGYGLQKIKKTQQHLLYIVDYISSSVNQNFNSVDVHYELLWHCAQELTYRDFYRAWHGLTETQTSPLVQTLNLAQLPQLLQTQLTETNLHQTLQLLCIDSSKFDNRDNPATDIYLQLVKKHHCPKSTEGTPRTLTDLKIYWELLDWDKHPILIFYEEAKPQGFSPTFLDAIARFDATICAIADLPHPTIPTFSPQDPHLIQTIITWLQRTILEA